MPASKINKCIIDQAIVSDGCIIHEATLKHCIIGIRSIIRSASRLERTVMIGADYCETPVDIAAAMDKGIPQIGIGMNCQITNAIIDKNARIGNDVTLSPHGKSDGMKGKGFVIKDGVIVVLKGAIIPNGTSI